MKIKKMGFGSNAPIIEQGYRDGGQFQWVRETVINAMEAGATRVEFGVEWQGVRNKGVYRRLIADNGKGMTADELEEYLNRFGGGGKAIGDAHENFGIGAKTSLLPWNPHGVVVVSWVDGEASMIRLRRGDDGDYGVQIEEVEDEDGDVVLAAAYAPHDDDEHGVNWELVKPDWIEDHGTVIVLMGRHAGDDTIRGDVERDEEGAALKGITAYLNQRLWNLQGTQITVTEFGSTEKQQWPTEPKGRATGFWQNREVRGAEYYVSGGIGRVAGEVQHGAVRMRDGQTVIDWYLWSGDEKKRAWQYAPARGFIAFFYKNELHSHSSHNATYRNFGISESVVRSNLWLIVRPPALDDDKKEGVYQKADRNQLVWAGGAPLPIEEWATEFADNMPQPIIDAPKAARADYQGGTADEALRERLAAQFLPRFKINRLRRKETGQEHGGATQPKIKLRKPQKPRKPPTPKPVDENRGRNKRGPLKPLVDAFGRSAAAAHARVRKGSLPEWAIVHEPIDDENPGLLADYAAPIPGISPAGLVRVYGEHPLFRQIVEDWQQRYPVQYADQIRAVVGEVYGTQAALKIAHSGHLRGMLPPDKIKEMRSPAGLTMALLGIMAEETIISQRMAGLAKRSKAA